MLTSALLPAAEPGGQEDSKPVIDKLAEPLVSQKRGTCLVVGVLTKQGRHVFGYGSLTGDGDRGPDGGTVFEIGSITKLFTAILLALLGQDGLVRLDDPIRLYLPDGVQAPKQGDREITLRHLATHTSGLPRLPGNFIPAMLRDINNPYAHYSEKELFAAVSEVQLKRAPGEKVEYSNFGMGLLGRLLVRKAGAKSYDELVVCRVCDPLGMKDTRITLSGEQGKRFAPGYKEPGKATPHWTMLSLEGAGALRSTANDLLTFLEANMGLRKTRLSAALEKCQAERPVPGSESKKPLGWIIKRVGNRQVIWHNGGTYGARSYLGFVREAQTGVVVLSNCGAFDRAIDRLGDEVLTALDRDCK